MQDDPATISEALEALFGGAVTTLIAGVTGRVLYHMMEVKRSTRKMFGKELMWEMPTAVGMALIAESVVIKVGVDGSMKTGAIAAIAFLGPRVIEEMWSKWAGKKE